MYIVELKSLFYKSAKGVELRRNRLSKSIAGAFTILATAGALLLASGQAQAISGGVKASKPWVVQVVAREGGGGENPDFTCTGSALNAELVLTAKHCIAHEVYYPDGTTVTVQSYYPVADTDVQVLVLSREHPLSDYPTIGPNYLAENHALPPGTVLRTYGYGLKYKSQQKLLHMKLIRHGILNGEKAPIEAFHANSTNGLGEFGDSGAPLMVNNLLVGVLHGLGNVKKGDNHQVIVFQGLSNAEALIRQYQHSREMRSINEDDSAIPWISAVNVQNGKLTATVDSNFAFYSGRDIAFWINGKYSGDITDFNCYYCSASFTKNSTGTLSLVQQVHLGDLLQIGIISGANNTPETAELLYENTLNGVEDVTIKDGRYDIRLSSELMNSGQRLIFWLNGAYAAEVFNGTTYYAANDKVPGGTIIHKGPATSESILQIAVVPGSPGTSIGTPATATKMLYSNAPIK